MSEPAIVAATADDVRSLARVRELDARSLAIGLQLIETSSLAWAARDDGEPVALALGHADATELQLSDLYVAPSFRGSGIGGALLDAVLDQADERNLLTIARTADAPALALLGLRGFTIRTPVVRLSGAIPREEALAKMAAGEYRFGVEPVDFGRHGDVLDSLDREARGVQRSADHERWLATARASLCLLDGEPVAYVYVWPDGTIGPVASASPAYAVQLLAFAFVSLARGFGATWCTMLAPGTNARVLRAALRAGLRIESSLLLATRGAAAEYDRYVGFHESLF